MTYSPATATDKGDEDVAITYSAGHASGSHFPTAATVVTATATDDDGKTDTCTFTVTVIDTTDPDITCANVDGTNTLASVEATGVVNNVGGATMTYSPATATDKGDEAVDITYSAGHASGSHFPTAATTVTATATDDDSNTAQCSFTVTVVDNTVPTISCANNDTNAVLASVEATAVVGGVGGATVNYTAATASDLGDESVTITYSQDSGTHFPTGTTLVTATATDDDSNVSTCSFTVTVVDNGVPTIACAAAPAAVEATGVVGGVGGATVTYTAATASDVGDETVDITYSHASGSHFPVGTTTVTATATDDDDNIASCSFNVVVTDGTVPTITCAAAPASVEATGVVGGVG